MKQNALAQDQPALRRYSAIGLSAVLWLVATVLTFFAVFALRDICNWLMALILIRPDSSVAARLNAADIINMASMCIIVLLGLLGISAIVVSGHEFFRHIGQPRLLRRLIGMIIVELVIVLPVAWFFWRM